MTSPNQRIVIIGGVAGGMSTAARLRRLDETARITIFERSGYVSFANCGLPYFTGQEITERDALLLQTPESLKERFNLNVHPHHEVLSIDRRAQTVSVKNRLTGETFVETYDQLVLSVGAAPIKPAMPGIDLPGLFTVRNIEDVDALENWIATHHPKRVVVAGGGFIGLEMAEQLKHRGLDVTLVQAQGQVLKPLDPEMAAYLHQALVKHGIQLVLNAPISGFKPVSDTNQTIGLVLAENHDPIATDMVILGLGVRPEVGLAKAAGLTIGALGGIHVNEHLQTSDPHIWAVGDAIEVQHPISQQSMLIPLGGPANRQGRIAANNIMGQQDTYPGTYGTNIIRVFDLTAASTGLNEGQLRTLNIPYESIYLHPSHHAGYYPGAQKIALKVLFNPTSGKLLGAQAVGTEGVDKRMDVLATALKANMSVNDLAELELSYAPPFGSAKDPINLAGMMGENIVEGLLTQTHWHEIATLDPNKTTLLDVRDEDERTNGSIPNSLHIPLGHLRERLAELPKNKAYVVYCQSGQRSYFATRLLKQQGFEANNLSGAYLTWKAATTAYSQTLQLA